MKLYEKSDGLMGTGNRFKNGVRLKSRMSRGNIMQKTFLFFYCFCSSIVSIVAQDVKSDVYVAGRDGKFAILWKNGVAQKLSDGTNDARASSVFVSGNDVYVAGIDGEFAILWKNGVAQKLCSIGRASSVFVVGSDVYVAGREWTQEKEIPTLWKNGIVQHLTAGGTTSNDNFATSVFISGKDVYVAGIDHGGGTIWKNGVDQRLESCMQAWSVFVAGNDVYVAGMDYGVAASLWKNGTLQRLTSSSPEAGAWASSVFVSGNDVYVVGVDDGINPILWKNGTAQSLTYEGIGRVYNSAQPTSVFVSGNDVYVAGNESVIVDGREKCFAILWKNGIAQRFTTENQFAGAYSVFINEGVSTVPDNDYVVINGVRWATRNVNKPGTFAAKPEDAGMLYQWNRKVGWSATDPLINSNGGTTWDSSMPAGSTWEKANDPSPAEWRVPTLVEIQKLLDTGKVSIEWITENGVNGRRFTDKLTGNSIFLPAVGDRDPNNGTRQFVGSVGDIWSSTQYSSGYAHNLYFDSGNNSGSVVLDWDGSDCRFGFSVRSVTESSISTDIDEILVNQPKVFPNPVKNDIFIQSDLPIEKVEIYSLTGTLLLTQLAFFSP